jgi:outer membrane protein TolC
MTELVQLLERRYNAGAIAEIDLVTARLALAEAQFWLEEAKWRGAKKGG